MSEKRIIRGLALTGTAAITLAMTACATDDAALVELTGVAVTVIDGDPRAVKVTTPRDLDLARTILQEDSHRAR